VVCVFVFCTRKASADAAPYSLCALLISVPVPISSCSSDTRIRVYRWQLELGRCLCVLSVYYGSRVHVHIMWGIGIVILFKTLHSLKYDSILLVFTV